MRLAASALRLAAGAAVALAELLLSGCASRGSSPASAGSMTTGSSAGGSATGSSTSGSATGSSAGGSATGSSAGGSATGSSTAGTTSGGATCSPDPLHTGLVAQQTGVSVDAFDCPILKWTAQYHEPDAMIFKAIIYVESRFDETSVACPNLPCGTPAGWTVAESGCYGLMQIVPACGGTPGGAGLLPNGHPNLTTSMTSPLWTGSVFNPDINIEIGISGVAGNRTQVKAQFSGCTEDQYTLMAVGNYNSYGSSKSCTVYNTAYDSAVLAAYKQYAMAAGYPAHAYP